MTLSDIALVGSMIVGLAVPGGAGLKYYADNEYITVSSQVARDIRELKRYIRELEYDRDNGAATEKDLWQLDQLRNDLEELEDQQ